MIQPGWPFESSVDQYNSPLQDPVFRHAYHNVIDKIFVVGDNMAYDVVRLRQEWLERVQGGVGCWKEGIPFRWTL
jgi:hypothetical protein